MECNSCALEERVKQLEKATEKNSEQHGEFYGRIGDLEKTSIARGRDLEYIRRGIDELKVDMQALKSRPAKRWEAIVAAVISAGVGSVIGFIISKLLGA